MKNFDKWWRRNGSHIHKLSLSMNNPAGKSHQEMCELAWKAALEWALDEMNKIDEATGENEYWMGMPLEEELSDE